MQRKNISFRHIQAVLTLVFFAMGWSLVKAQTTNQPNGSTHDVPGALPGIHIVSPVPNGQWTMPAGDYANTRYSPLDKINASNVKNLKIAATFSTGIPHGHEGQPLVVGSTLYIVTPYPNNLIAIDLSKPGFPTKWVFHPNPDVKSQGVACCDIVNRGATLCGWEDHLQHPRCTHGRRRRRDRPTRLGNAGGRRSDGRDDHDGAYRR